MRLKRPYVTIPAAIALLAVAAFLLAWIFARTPFARGLAAGWIEDATGLPAAVEGLRIGFLRGPSVTISGVSIGQPPGFGEGRLLEVGEARLDLPWSALFGGAAVDAVAVTDAVARPAIGVDGGDNWSALIERLGELGGESGAAWSIGEIALVRGALEYSDATSGSAWRLTAVTFTARELAPGAEFPLELQLAGVSGPNTFHLAANGRATLDPDAGRYGAAALTLRGWAGGEPLPLAGIELAGTIVALDWDGDARSGKLRDGTFNVAGVPGAIAGEITLGEGPARLELRVRTETFAPRAPAISFGSPLPETADPAAFGAVQAAATLTFADGEIRLDPIEAQLDDSHITGSMTAERRQVRLEVDRIDVDRYLAPGKTSRRDKKATLEAAVEDLRALDLDAEIRIGVAKVAGATLKDTVVRIERDLAAP